MISTASNLQPDGFLTNLINKPMEHTMIPTKVTAEPFVVQSGLLYMKEEEGPNRPLLCATKTRPKPMRRAPIKIIEISKLLGFGKSGIMRLSIVPFNSFNITKWSS